MTTDTSRHIVELGEVTRALAHDLDLSRRLVTELRRENDDLVHDADTARNRANRAVETLHALVEQLRATSKSATDGVTSLWALSQP